MQLLGGLVTEWCELLPLKPRTRKKQAEQQPEDAHTDCEANRILLHPPGGILGGLDADPELALYDGFLADADKPLLRAVRQTPPEQLGQHAFAFQDPRYAELLFRYRARNWPLTLNADEHQRWDEFRHRRLETATALTPRTLDDYFTTITELRADAAITPDQRALLDRLEYWGRTIL